MNVQNLMDGQHIKELFKDFLTCYGYTNTLDCFNAEGKSLQILAKGPKNPQPPKIYNFLNMNNLRQNDQDAQNKAKIELIHKKYLQMLEAGRQIFSVSINMIVFMSKNREVLHFFKK